MSRRTVLAVVSGALLYLCAWLAYGVATPTRTRTRTLMPTRTATRTFTPVWLWVEDTTRTPLPSGTPCPHSECIMYGLTPKPVVTSTKRWTPRAIEIDEHYPPGPFVAERVVTPPYEPNYGITVTPGSRVAVRGWRGDQLSRIQDYVTAPPRSFTPTRRPTGTPTRTAAFTRTAAVTGTRTPTPGGPTPTPPDCFPLCPSPTSGPPPTKTVTRSPVPTTTPSPLPTRFQILITWTKSDGSSGSAQKGADAGQGAWYWYFDPTNPEEFVAVLNACGVNGQYWVKIFGGTNVAVTTKIHDRIGGGDVTYTNPANVLMETVIDTHAFPCGAP